MLRSILGGVINPICVSFPTSKSILSFSDPQTSRSKNEPSLYFLFTSKICLLLKFEKKNAIFWLFKSCWERIENLKSFPIVGSPSNFVSITTFSISIFPFLYFRIIILKSYPINF
jgi:hypothetical protein